ncbi:MAG TPA: type IV pilus assembly protein PilM [Planctomycetaceae bacterium]|nr:type IV pilus assembly protein PilM [Planctomycetaceae bacterium]
MAIWDWTRRSWSPIGIEVGSSGVRMVQLSHDGTRLHAMGRRELPPACDGDLYSGDRQTALIDAIDSLRAQSVFRGRRAVVVLNDRQLLVQNLRVPRVSELSLPDLVERELAERLPYPIGQAEVRHVTVGEVRQGDRLYREVIVFAARSETLHHIVTLFDKAGLQVCAMDVEPAALIRSFLHEYRRDEDRASRTLMVHIGTARTVVLVCGEGHPLLIKYLQIGGRQFDQAVAEHLDMELRAAASLRRHQGDRRASRRDPDVLRSVREATRPVVERLISELAMCCRYYSVTFRGSPLSRVLLGGGEADADLARLISQRLNLAADVAQPFRHIRAETPIEDAPAWDVAVGAALRERYASPKPAATQPAECRT